MHNPVDAGGTGELESTDIALLADKVRERFPGADTTLDPAANAEGVRFLDIVRDGRHVVVQWRRGLGFGVSSNPDAVYGDGADELYDGVEASFARIVSLLLGGKHTSPPPLARMAELRKARGVSQKDLASKLEINQAAISKLEHRGDVLLSTIRQVINAMGGELHVIARFPDGMEKTLNFETPTDARRFDSR